MAGISVIDLLCGLTSLMFFACVMFCAITDEFDRLSTMFPFDKEK